MMLVADALAAQKTPPLLNETVVGVSTDSRTVGKGDLFFALRGDSFDGHQFVSRAVGRGAVAAVVEADRMGDIPPWCRERVFVVENSRRALARLAARYRATLNATVVGVTGSCGKTTTKDLISAVLSARMRGTASKRSFNNDIGVPLSLFDVEEHHEFAVIEIGANAPGEIADLAAVAAPRVGVITCIRPVHLEGFGSMQGVVRAKSELVDTLPRDGVFVFNPEEQGMVSAASRYEGGIMTFGTWPSATLKLEGASCGQTSLCVNVRGHEIRVPLIGRHNVMNVLAALSVGLLLGISLEEMARALRNFVGPQGRMMRRDLGDVTVIDDAYNANPASVLSAIRTFAGMETPGRKILVLGDMMELGPRSVDFHIFVGRAAAEMKPDLTVSVGPLSGATAGAMVARGIPADRILHFEKTQEAAGILASLVRKGDMILLKASRRMRFEKIREAVENIWSASRRLQSVLARS
jgi:UDP-N-acetylmuramoyl-tripeptide--D-alanyl-D-alanine ligase